MGSVGSTSVEDYDVLVWLVAGPGVGSCWEKWWRGRKSSLWLCRWCWSSASAPEPWHRWRMASRPDRRRCPQRMDMYHGSA